MNNRICRCHGAPSAGRLVTVCVPAVRRPGVRTCRCQCTRSYVGRDHPGLPGHVRSAVEVRDRWSVLLDRRGTEDSSGERRANVSPACASPAC